MTPARAGDNLIMATVRDAQGAPIPSVVSVEVIASLQAAGIEEVRVRGEPVGNGMWHATVSDMVIPGDWKLVIDAFVTDYDKVTFESQVTIR